MKKIQESTFKKIFYFLCVPLLLLFAFILSLLNFGEGYIKKEAENTVIYETTLYANDLQNELLVNLQKTTELLEKFKPKEKGFKTKIKEKFTDLFVKKEETGTLQKFIDSSKEKMSKKIEEQFHKTLTKVEKKYGIILKERTYQGVIDEINDLKIEIAKINIDEDSIESIIAGNNYNFENDHIVSKTFNHVRDYYNNTLELLIDDLMTIPLFGFIVYLLAVLGGYFTKREDDFFYPMLVATIVVLTGTGMYIFNQDWIYNVLTNNFVGGTYTIVMSIILLFELDIIINKARITEWLLRRLPDIIENIELPDIELPNIDFPDI